MSNRQSSICLPSEIDVNAVTFSPPRVLEKTGGKMIYVYHNKKPLVMQIPLMVAPYGLSAWPNDGSSAPTKYSLDVSFQGHETDAHIGGFLELVKAFDDYLVSQGKENSLNWFKTKYSSVDVVRALYTPMLKYSKGENGEISNKYPPTFKFQVPFKDGQFMCETYNAQRELIDLNSVNTKRARVTAILQCNGIYVAGNKFSCTWKVLQMKINPSADGIPKGYAFIDDDEDINTNE